ncbi:MAG: PQQ-binding-like beta-propeller repeat protein [Rudaea sp.]|nr:PQQ-binding-like beta-propeller repeat protein [Rudaea sp.]
MAHATDWLQFGSDAAHGSYNSAERGYSTATGNQLAFAPVTLPAVADSAPIFVGDVATGTGIRDLLLVATMDGSLLALNAADGSLVWSQKPAGAGMVTTGSPAVEPGRQYVYAYGLDGKVHKYQLGDGTEVLATGWPQVSTLKPDVEKGASALTIATTGGAATYLYSVTNSYYDGGDYQGHLTSINLSTGVQAVFNAQCSDLTFHFVKNGISSGSGQDDCQQIASAKAGQTAGSGIWGRPGAVYDAGTNRVYVATGNGLFDPVDMLGNGIDWGDSVLALNPDGSGSGVQGMPVDSYTPSTYVQLQDSDADLGSTSPAILPAPVGSNVAHLGLQGGKDGCVRLLNLDMLGGSAGAGHIGGELQTVDLPGGNQCAEGGNLGTFKAQAAVWVNPADASTWVFVAHNAGIVAYQVVVTGSGNPALSQVWTSSDSGTSPVVANATVYYVQSGVVRALDAATGSAIWSDARIGGIHWQSPIVVNSRLYVTDEQAQLWVYQLDGIFRDNFR